MAGRRILYLLAWAGCLIFFLAYRLWFSWFLLILILGLPVFSLIVSLPGMLTARLEPEPTGPMPMGTKKPLRLHCRSRFPVAAWKCRIEVWRTLTGDMWFLKNGDTLPSDHCGELSCAVKKARVYDLLGLFCLPLRCPEELTIPVRPAPVSMESAAAMKHRTVHHWRPKPGGGYSENHELRPYRPGDSVRDIHWKLSAKTGQLILRESMVPVRDRVLVRLDLRGTPAELDRLLGRLLWLGVHLLELDIHFEVHALTGIGHECWPVTDLRELLEILDVLLSRPQANEGTLHNRPEQASWCYEIGGEPDEP